MPYLTLGATTDLQIKVPTNGTTDWGDTLKTDTFQKIAEHDHTGTGKGKQLGTGSLLANAVNGTRLRLSNDEYIRARDNADSVDINIVKVNTNDDVEFGTQIAVLKMKNDSYITARNFADNADIDIVKLDVSDNVILSLSQVNALASVTLTDNTAVAADALVITLAGNETCKIQGKLVRGADTRRVELELDQANANIIESGLGDDVGVTFSIAADQLQYTTTSTGANATFTYTIIKE